MVEFLSDVSAMQGQDGLHMVSVVEAMLYAAEEHDRLLLDCEHERLHHPEDCMFDIDLQLQSSASEDGMGHHPYHPALQIDADLRGAVSCR